MLPNSLRRDGEPLPLLAMEEPMVGVPTVLVLRVREDAGGGLAVRRTTPVLRIEP